MQFFGEEENLLGSIIGGIKSKYPQQESNKNWGTFAIIFTAGLILIIISIPFASFLILNPKPFCLLFSAGSFIILTSMSQIIQIKELFQKISSSIALIIYICSVAACLYTGLFYIGYFYTLALLSLQISTLMYLIISLFPGGKTGMHAAYFLLKNRIQNIFVKQPFLPL